MLHQTAPSTRAATPEAAHRPFPAFLLDMFCDVLTEYMGLGA